jgi:hypothetical protein
MMTTTFPLRMNNEDYQDDDDDDDDDEDNTSTNGQSHYARHRDEYREMASPKTIVGSWWMMASRIRTNGTTL